MHDRANDRYFRAPADSLPQSVRCALRDAESRLSEAIAVTALVITVLSWAAVALISMSKAPPDGRAVLAAIVTLVLSLAVHESAHVLTLRAFGRRADRIGLKLNYWVFPAVYVRMSQTMLLGRSEQVAVHLAGIASNVLTLGGLLLVNVLWIDSASITFAVHLTTLLLGWNLLPVLGSDGFRVLLALRRTDAAQGFRNNPLWLNLLRGAGIVAAVFFVLHHLMSFWK